MCCVPCLPNSAILQPSHTANNNRRHLTFVPLNFPSSHLQPQSVSFTLTLCPPPLILNKPHSITEIINMPVPKALLCTSVTVDCPVTASIYGYYPNKGANLFFAVLFGILGLIQVAQGIKYKSWTYMTALGLGCLCETVGYVGRILLNSNPFSSAGFEMQICCLIIAPVCVRNVLQSLKLPC